MTVALLPPITRSSFYAQDADPITEAPQFIRTRGMSRWHRPRDGMRWTNGRTTYGAWCGYGIGGLDRAGQFLGVDEITDGLPVCATCDGRSVGAGQIADGPVGRTLLFTPRWLTPPPTCPASRKGLFVEMPGGRVGKCLVCGDLQPLRAMGGPYNSHYSIVQHPTGAAVIPPCPFHRWNQLTATDGTVRCACGRELTP